MLRHILLAFAIAIASPSPAFADDLARWYEHFKRELPGVWRDILRPSIRQTHPGVDRRTLNQIRIRIDESACEFSPISGRSADGTPEIIIPTGFIRLWLYSDQARLLFHSGDPRFEDPEIYVRYIRTNLKDIINRVSATCATRNAGEQGSVIGDAVAQNLGLSTREYNRLLARLKVRPDQMMLGDQFGYGIMFVVMHEAGHLLLDEPEGIEGEFEMDRFASEVLRDQGQSTFLAIGGIAVLAIVKSRNFDSANSNADICRIYEMIRDDPYIEPHLQGFRIGHFAPDMERLRRHLARRLRPVCAAGR